MINSYFQSGNISGTANEQNLVADLIIESIKIYGAEIHYLPRTSVKQDNILGEDILQQFTQQYPIECYLNNVQGWEGNSELMTKFGIQVNDSATFVVAKRRWEEAIALQTDFLQLPERPAEGDLLFFPLTNAFFEITYVQHLNPFFQLGKFYVYELRATLYQYSSEPIVTGDTIIDTLAISRSQDQLNWSLLNQAGGRILNQNGGSILLEGFDASQNPLSVFDQAQEKTTILDFTETNPFGEI
jgi:hypothetical protein